MTGGHSLNSSSAQRTPLSYVTSLSCAVDTACRPFFFFCLALSPIHCRIFVHIASKRADNRISSILRFVYLLIIHMNCSVRRSATPLLNRCDAIQFPTGFPGDPAACHELKIKSTTSSTPVPSLMLVKIVGPSPLMSLASRSMTARDADTNGAISI